MRKTAWILCLIQTPLWYGNIIVYINLHIKYDTTVVAVNFFHILYVAVRFTPINKHKVLF